MTGHQLDFEGLGAHPPLSPKNGLAQYSSPVIAVKKVDRLLSSSPKLLERSIPLVTSFAYYQKTGGTVGISARENHSLSDCRI